MMAYPENDPEYREYTIKRVEAEAERTYSLTFDDGWSLWSGRDCPIVPKVGHVARLYGKGFGFQIRGLFINGAKFWYRTEAEENEHREIESYGADATDWLARWDAGRSVFSIEMSGLGPGYEQCIQITAAEVLRWYLTNKPDASLWRDADAWRAVCDDMEKALFEVSAVKELGLSGAQWGAAVNLASQFYRHGPRGVMNRPDVKARHIQVSRDFPGAGRAALREAEGKS